MDQTVWMMSHPEPRPPPLPPPTPSSTAESVDPNNPVSPPPPSSSALVPIPRRKAACTACHAGRTRCIPVTSTDHRKSCVRCLKRGLKCDVVQVNEPHPSSHSPSSSRVTSPGTSPPSRPLVRVASPVVVLGPSASTSKLNSYHLSDSMAHHLLDTYLAISSGFRLGFKRSAFEERLRKAGGISGLRDEDKVLALSFMCQGARISNHSSLVKISEPTINSTSLVAFNSTRSQAISSLQESLLPLLDNLSLEETSSDEDDLDAVADRLASFMIASESVETPAKPKERIERDRKKLEQAVKTAKRLEKDERKSSGVFGARVLQLALKNLVLATVEGLPPPISKVDFLQLYDRHIHSNSSTTSIEDDLILGSDLEWIKIVTSLGCPSLRTIYCTLFDILDLSDTDPSLLPFLRTAIQLYDKTAMWIVDHMTPYNEDRPTPPNPDEAKLLQMFCHYESWSAIQYLTLWARLDVMKMSSTDRKGRRREIERAEVLQGLTERLVFCLRTYMHRAKIIMKWAVVSKERYDLFRFAGWVVALVVNRLGPTRTLGVLEDMEIKFLLAAFTQISRNDPESIKLVQLCEQQLAERTYRHRRITSSSIASASLVTPPSATTPLPSVLVPSTPAEERQGEEESALASAMVEAALLDLQKGDMVE